MSFHSPVFSIRFKRPGTLWLLICVVTMFGCGNSHKVQPEVAQNTLRTTLESWKSGQTPESLRKATPSIVVQDLDWTSGAKLVEYEILEGGKPVDANLYAQVKLKLRDAGGSESGKTVTYVVGTSPALTVFRSMMP